MGSIQGQSYQSENFPTGFNYDLKDRAFIKKETFEGTIQGKKISVDYTHTARPSLEKISIFTRIKSLFLGVVYRLNYHATKSLDAYDNSKDFFSLFRAGKRLIWIVHIEKTTTEQSSPSSKSDQTSPVKEKALEKTKESSLTSSSDLSPQANTARKINEFADKPFKEIIAGLSGWKGEKGEIKGR